MPENQRISAVVRAPDRSKMAAEKPAETPKIEPKQTENRQIQPKIEVKTVEITSFRIEFPLIPRRDGYHQQNYSIRLTEDQSVALHRLFGALNHAHAPMANGNHVDKPIHAIQWILEQIGSAK